MESYTRFVSDAERRKKIRNPPPRRGQVKAKIFRSIAQSVADVAARAALAVAGSSTLNSPASSNPPSAYSGFFTGLSPASTAIIFSGREGREFHANKLTVSGRDSVSIQNADRMRVAGNFNRSLMGADAASSETGNWNESGLTELENLGSEPEPTRRLLIIVTPTSVNHALQGAYLRNLGYTLRSVPHPLLWIVVEPQTDSSKTVETLRQSGVMYRHLVSRENFTSPAELIEYQRSLALNHIEHHRLDGIVHFADAFNVYDLQFFEEIRGIEVFGTWPVAMIYANKKKVGLVGPVCNASQVVGWHADVKNSSNHNNPNYEFAINTYGFAFNSTILWDPERWGRPSSTPIAPDQLPFSNVHLQTDDQ